MLSPICSNADIARQNVKRLSIRGFEAAAQATRLTLLPLQLKNLQKNRVNFVALTPATSFEQTGGGGRMDERVLLYWLLDRHGEFMALAQLYTSCRTTHRHRLLSARLIILIRT